MRSINRSYTCFLCPAAKFFQTKTASIILAVVKRQENLHTGVKRFYLWLKSRMGKYSISWVTTRLREEKGRKYFWVSHTQVVSWCWFYCRRKPNSSRKCYFLMLAPNYLLFPFFCLLPVLISLFTHLSLIYTFLYVRKFIPSQLLPHPANSS